MKIIYAFVGLSVIAALGLFISPDELWFLSILSYVVPMGLLLNLLLAIGMLFSKTARSKAWLPLLPFALSWQVLASIATFNDKSAEKGDIGVLNFNVRFFYTPPPWAPEYGNPEYEVYAAPLQDWINHHEADIVCLQEFFTDSTYSFYNHLKSLREYRPYTYFLTTDVKARAQRGMLILSKWPIVRKGQIFMSKNGYNGAMYADLKVGKDTVRIINTHLQSVEWQLAPRNKGIITRGTNMYYRFKHSFLDRFEQAIKIQHVLEKTPYPVVLTGGLNEPPFTFTYKILRDYLDDSFSTAGNGLGVNYEGYWLMLLRLNHQLFAGNIAPVSYETHDVFIRMQHDPVYVRYSVNKN